jgi:hypothetical protein
LKFNAAGKVGVLVLSMTAVLATAMPNADASAKPKTHVTINHSAIHLGSSATVAGSVSPNLHKHVVYLQRRTNSKWHSVAHQKLNTKSRYAFKVKPTKVGTYTYRVYDPKTASGRPKSYSATVKLTVRRAAPASNCTPGYSPCIPPGSDVDCAGGSGNGPRYVDGPVYVTGSDPYDLDRDGDGVACE